jgi:hypothetical protein
MGPYAFRLLGIRQKEHGRKQEARVASQRCLRPKTKAMVELLRSCRPSLHTSALRISRAFPMFSVKF